jgi:energy-coupling factor transporter ATP-binding protein EcfA2
VFIRPSPAPAQNNQPSAPGARFHALPYSSSGCFNYGKSGHFIKDCPYPKKNKSNFQQTLGNANQGKGNVFNPPTGKNMKKTGQVYYTQVATTPEGEPVMMDTFLVANHPAVILFDSGASHTFMSKTFVEKHCIHSTESREGFVIHSPEGQIFTKEVVFHVPVTLAGREFPNNMIVIKGHDIDVILGMNWLAQNKAIINADQRTIQLSHGQEQVKLFVPIAVPVKTSRQVFEAIVQEI